MNDFLMSLLIKILKSEFLHSQKDNLGRGKITDKLLTINNNNMARQSKNKAVAIFEGKTIRRVWDDEKELWYFSVVDVIEALTDSTQPSKYWTAMKVRVNSNDGFQLSTVCRQLKLESSDGKRYETDCVNTEGVFRIIQSIPSPKAEPFKLWLARVGYERIEETEDPEKAIQRALATYLKKGYSKEWVDLRLKSIEIRKDLTNEWDERGVKTNDEFAILTDDISFAWAGLKAKDYKRHKDLKAERPEGRRRGSPTK